MTGFEYQCLAMRTNDRKATNRLLDITLEDGLIATDTGAVLDACLGLSGEAGEFNDMIKKWIFHEKELDVEHLKKECGDVLWYVAMLCDVFNWSLDDVMQTNIDKLRERYPDGFDVDRANNRKAGDV